MLDFILYYIVPLILLIIESIIIFILYPAKKYYGISLLICSILPIGNWLILGFSIFNYYLGDDK